MQEAARACPASAPCPDHDARTRVCAGVENRTRNAWTLHLQRWFTGGTLCGFPWERRACFLLPTLLAATDWPQYLLGRAIRPQQGPAARLADNYNTTMRVNR